MAMDSIRGDCERDTLFVLARDGEGAIRGVLHFVPCYGAPGGVAVVHAARSRARPTG